MSTTGSLLRASGDMLQNQTEWAAQLIEATVSRLECLRTDIDRDVGMVQDPLAAQMLHQIEDRLRQIIMRLEGP